MATPFFARFFKATPPPVVEAKTSGSMLAYSHLGQPVWTPRDYGALAREGFARNFGDWKTERDYA